MNAIQKNLILDQRIFLALDIKNADPADVTSRVGWQQGNTYINNTSWHLLSTYYRTRAILRALCV